MSILNKPNQHAISHAISSPMITCIQHMEGFAVQQHLAGYNDKAANLYSVHLLLLLQLPDGPQQQAGRLVEIQHKKVEFLENIIHV